MFERKVRKLQKMKFRNLHKYHIIGFNQFTSYTGIVEERHNSKGTELRRLMK